MTPEQVTQRLNEVARWLGAQDTPNTNEARKDVLEGARTVAELARFLDLADNGMREQAARYKKDIRELNRRTGLVIDARNAFITSHRARHTDEQLGPRLGLRDAVERLCDKIDSALFGDSLSEPNPPGFHPNLSAFATECLNDCCGHATCPKCFDHCVRLECEKAINAKDAGGRKCYACGEAIAPA